MTPVAATRWYLGDAYSGPSPTVVRACQTSVKSSLTHTYTWSSMDNDALPTSGKYARVCTELAGLGGDVRFVKTEATARYAVPLSPRTSLCFSAMGGLLKPWGNTVHSKSTHSSQSSSQTSSSSSSSSSVCVSPLDRFYLGGPLTLRGFHRSMVGPRDCDDATGGDAYLATAAAVSTLLPGRAGDAGIRAHAFVNAGNLVQVYPTVGASAVSPSHTTLAAAAPPPSLASVASSLVGGARVSAGVGVVFPTPWGRLELNASRPLRRQADDLVQQFQVGFGFVYL
jgi:outer membrane protein insertion porin family